VAPLSRKDKRLRITLLHPSLSCATSIQLTFPVVLILFCIPSFHLGFGAPFGHPMVLFGVCWLNIFSLYFLHYPTFLHVPDLFHTTKEIHRSKIVINCKTEKLTHRFSDKIYSKLSWFLWPVENICAFTFTKIVI